jgi:hypothetical protein
MEIHLTAAETARLAHPGDFGAFTVVAHSLSSPGQLRAALASVGLPADDNAHVFVDPGWLIGQASGVTDQTWWNEGFAAMVRFATGRGWVDEVGRIRAHVEHVDD